ncbi:MAG: HAMP domain-containing sensor histidine kinase [Anaeromyxobacteraceae bacterium]
MQATTAWPFILALLFAAALPLGWAALVRGRLGRARQELHATEQVLADERGERVWLASRAVTELEKPLRLLGASLELALRRRRDTTELAASIEDAKREVDRLSTLAGRILVLVEPRTRREAGDLAAVVRQAIEATKEQARLKQIEVTVDGPDRLPAQLDVKGLTQAVVELLTNALRVSRFGGHVRVEVEHSRGKARVKVSDEGPGFGNALPETVFEPFLFHRTAPAAGFGLALARKVAREHGGDVTLGKGKVGAEVVMELATA